MNIQRKRSKFMILFCFQVHVERHKVEVYSQIQEFHDNFTSDGSSTQIHACGKEV